MFSLYGSLPDSICVAGENWPIPTDFRRWIWFDVTVKKGLNPENILEILTRFDLPFDKKNMEALFKALFSFYNMGEADEEPAEDQPRPIRQKEMEPLFCYEKDAVLLFAAFWQTYQIDLLKTSLHWWEFRALQRGLPKNTAYYQVVQLRATDPNKYKGEQKSEIMKLKNQVAIKPKNRKRMTLAKRNQLLIHQVKDIQKRVQTGEGERGL